MYAEKQKGPRNPAFVEAMRRRLEWEARIHQVNYQHTIETLKDYPKTNVEPCRLAKVRIYPQEKLEFGPLAEGRKKGGPLGAQANYKRAMESRKTIARLAKELWERRPELKDNMSATAREIFKQGGVGHLGVEAIRKHLSKARKEGLL
jgi:hypothetical protein